MTNRKVDVSMPVEDMTLEEVEFLIRDLSWGNRNANTDPYINRLKARRDNLKNEG